MPNTGPAHPMQPLVLSAGGTVRFKENKIVSFILAEGGVDLNRIGTLPFSNEDRMQFAQLIGYWVGGYGDLSYASSESVAAADRAADRLVRGMDAEQESEVVQLRAENDRLRAVIGGIQSMADNAIGRD